MIISRTPFRISFFGGGTDYPIWYNKYGGQTISVTINKYCFIIVRYLPPFFDYNYRIRYYQHEETNSMDDIKHPSVRECLKYLKIDKGVEIVHNADLPAMSGLGSSSTFTVGLLNSLYALQNYMPTKRELAINAIHVEQNKIKEFVGSQDQTAAAFGGLNRITFNKAKNIDVDPIILSEERKVQLQDNLMLFFTGFTRIASSIAEEQLRLINQNKTQLNKMIEICDKGFEILIDKSQSLDQFGYLLNEQWQLKRGLAKNISNNSIDKIYDNAIKAGAIGGKLLGAGGGGFILFYVPKEKQEKLKNILNDISYVPFRFEYTGSKIIYYSHHGQQ